MALDPDPYRILGLSRGASLDDVKRAYRRLAKVNHPDAAGPGATPRFLAIKAAYEQIAGSSSPPVPTGRPAPTTRRRPSAADPDRSDASRRAYGGRTRSSRPGPSPADGAPSADPPPTDPPPGARPQGAPGAARPAGSTAGGASRTRAARGKATLGSTSYDGADAGPFEPDWGGASWYGTTSGTYWTINPKEYADPRKHGPEYLARARRSTNAGVAGTPPAEPAESGWSSGHEPVQRASHEPAQRAAHEPAHQASHEPAPPREGPRPAPMHDPRPTGTEIPRSDQPPLDPARAAVELVQALTDPTSGGLRGRVLRAVLGWLPICLGVGWLLGELTGCGRFAATCDPSVAPLTAVGQVIVLAALLLVPEVSAIAAGAALVLLAAAVAASLILSATGAAADEASRRAALGALLLVAWLSGLAIAVVRRLRSGPRTAGPVS